MVPAIGETIARCRPVRVFKERGLAYIRPADDRHLYPLGLRRLRSAPSSTLLGLDFRGDVVEQFPESELVLRGYAEHVLEAE